MGYTTSQHDAEFHQPRQSNRGLIDNFCTKIADSSGSAAPSAVRSFHDFLTHCARVRGPEGLYVPYTFTGREPLIEIVQTIDKVLGSDGGVPHPDATIAICGGAQFGKSALELNLGAYCTAVAWLNWGLYLPNRDLVEGMVDTKFRPDVLDQIDWLARMTQLGKTVNRSGKSVNRKGAFSVTNGARRSHGMILGLNRIPTSFTFDVTTLDEVDDIKPAREKFVRGRMTSSAVRLLVKVGTQRVAGRGQHKAWKDGSQGVLLHRCPRCEKEQNLEENWPRICRVALSSEPNPSDPVLTYTGDFRHHDTGPTMAVHNPTQHYYYGCIYCGAELNRNTEKVGFKWHHRRPERLDQRHWSFRMSQFAIAAIDLSQIVAEWVRAVADPEAMATFLCDRKAMPESTAQKLTPEILARSRASELENSNSKLETPITPLPSPATRHPSLAPSEVGRPAEAGCAPPNRDTSDAAFNERRWSTFPLSRRTGEGRGEGGAGISPLHARPSIPIAPASPNPKPETQNPKLELDAPRTTQPLPPPATRHPSLAAYGGLDTGRRCWFFARAVHAPDLKRVLHLEQIPLANLVAHATELFHALGLRALFIDQAPATDEARTLALRLNGLEHLQSWPAAPKDKTGFISLPGGLRWNGATQRWENVRCAVVAFTKRRLGAGITHGFDVFEKGSQTMFVPLIEANRFETIDRVVREFLTPAENVSEVIFAPGQPSYVRTAPSMRLPDRGRGAPIELETLDEHLLAGSERVELPDGSLGDYVDGCENHFLLANAYSGLAELEAGARSLPGPEPIHVFETTRHSQILSTRHTRHLDG